MKKLLIPFFVLLIVVIGLLGYLFTKTQNIPNISDNVPSTIEEQQDTDTAKFAAVQTLGIPLLEVNSSTQMGGAIFEQTEEGKLKVNIDVTPLDGDQSANINFGSCPTPGEVAFELTSVQNGKGEITIDPQLQNILKELPMAVTIQKSASDATLTACGDIMLPSEE